MYIRRTKTKTLDQGGGYYTYRIVESIRFGDKVKQRTLLNLGKDFPIPKEHWPLLTKRIEQLMQQPTQRQEDLFDLSDNLDKSLEASAQHYCAQILRKLSRPSGDSSKNLTDLIEPDYHTVDINHLEAFQPRSIGAETIAFFAFMQLKLSEKLHDLGFSKVDISAAIGNIIGRMVSPGSELHTHGWLIHQSALGELIDHDYGDMSLTRLYTVSDKLLSHQTALESFLSDREKDLFNLSRSLVLYDLTNTYFEGGCEMNTKAKHGRSKEKRKDCPLVTLGLVLDGDGFPLNSQVFAGNASESGTLETMLNSLKNDELSSGDSHSPVVIMDAGIASAENVEWLKNRDYRYIVVSREKRKEHPEESENKVFVRDDNKNRVTVFKEVCIETEEIRLYCHSELKEKKEAAIRNRFHERLEEALNKLHNGLSKKGTIKKYEKIVERVGRLREKNSTVSKDYSIAVIPDEDKKKAVGIEWHRDSTSNDKDRNCGVYCLRTNIKDWSEEQLWETYITLTEIESTFRSMKSELGMRPVYHQTESRVTGHLFITLLAYHLVHTLRYQLKQKGINWSWESIRKIMSTQQRVRVSMPTNENQMIHVRTTTKAEVEQKIIYQALGIEPDPIGSFKTIIKRAKSVVPTETD
jgi:transposase